MFWLPGRQGGASRVCPPPHARSPAGGAAPPKDTAMGIAPEHLLTTVLAVRIAGDDLRTATRYLLGRAVRAGAEQIRRENQEAR